MYNLLAILKTGDDLGNDVKNQHAAAAAEILSSSVTDQSGLSGSIGYRWYPTL